MPAEKSIISANKSNKYTELFSLERKERKVILKSQFKGYVIREFYVNSILK